MHNWKDFKKSINSLIDCQSNAVEVVKKWNLIKKQYNKYNKRTLSVYNGSTCVLKKYWIFSSPWCFGWMRCGCAGCM